MNKSKNILFVLHLTPPIHGASLVGESIKNSEIINNSFHCNYVNLSSSKDLKDTGKFGLNKLVSLLSIYWEVFHLLWLSKPDLCYVTLNSKGSAFYKDFGIVLLIKIFKKKIVYHFHNKGVALNQNNVIDNLLYRITFRKAHAILISPLLYNDVEKYLPRNCVSFCPNGIASETVIHKETIKSESIRILFISNMMKAKGVLDLISACEILMQKGIFYRCDFVGKWFDIEETDFERTITDKKLNERVFAHGAQYGAAKNDFYRKADIFVLPSHNEVFPLVLLEAMQFGLPVISTSVGAIPEIIDDRKTGLLIKKENITDLVSKIEILAASPKMREEYGSNGQIKFQQNYTFDKFENNFKKSLDKILIQ